MNKKFSIFIYIELVSSILFSIFSINFRFDLSILASVLSIAFTATLVYFSYVRLLRPLNANYVRLVRELSEYLPFVMLVSFILRRAGKFGTTYFYDVITVLLWIILTVSSFIISYYFLSDKRIKRLTESWNVKYIVQKKYKGYKRILFEVFSWIDALIQSVFTVLLVQIFILQLYEIPSESMVPTFLVKDRVLVSKIDAGPKFPLTDVGLPTFRKYKRGDIVVLRNPHYSIDRQSEVKSVVSQLVYMFTIMTVNLNKDDNGELKADPLVKRIVGESGEQLVMQDGILYARTKDDVQFKPVTTENNYAAWNISDLDKNTLDKVRITPLSKDEYKSMIDFEEFRRNYNLIEARNDVIQILNSLKQYLNKTYTSDFTIPSLYEFDLFKNVQSLSGEIITKKNGYEWFVSFLNSWIPEIDTEKDIYSEANYKINVMSKVVLGKLVLKYANYIRNEVPYSSWVNDEELLDLYSQAEEINWYIQLINQRNMGIFPKNDEYGNPQYIPENCFFMMGDNRFNSLDLRHSYSEKLIELTTYDKNSVQYYSNVEPQYINKKYLLGKPLFRFWPTSRVGLIK
ncbi:MAG: signal peptidase I [Treponema sp.]|nr:signal peptidase I [Treponema sp.]